MSNQQRHSTHDLGDGVVIDEYEMKDNFRTDMEEALREKYGPAPTCLKCIHMKTCVIFRNVDPMMQSMFGMLVEKDRPFKGEELAKICKEYEHSIVEKPEEFQNKNA